MSLKEDLLKNDLSNILDTLNEDASDLSSEDIEATLEENINRLKEEVIKYNKEANFQDDDILSDDFKIARNVLMDSLNKSQKITEIIFEEILAVNLQNPNALMIAQ